MSTNFFNALNAACATRNAELDALYEEKRAQADANRAQEEKKKKIARRNWAVGVLECGNMPLDRKENIAAAMMIATTDPEIPHKEVERLLLKQEKYRQIISQRVVEEFQKRGGDLAGELGLYCVQRAYNIPLGSDLFDSNVAQDLAMALLVLDRFGDDRPEVKGVFKTLRRLFPFTKKGNLQNIPHGLGKKLYPEHYDRDGRCVYRFASRQETSEPRRISDHRQPERPAVINNHALAPGLSKLSADWEPEQARVN